MRNPNKDRTPQQIIDHWNHPIPQPDTEEARQARVGLRFRMYFLLDPDRLVAYLSRRRMNARHRARARATLAEVEQAEALMREPQNAFLVPTHNWHVAWLLAELGKLAA